jgi:hypothetical protein
MRVKAITALVILAATAGIIMAMHRESRADAASGNCYASADGPSTPVICD